MVKTGKSQDPLVREKQLRRELEAEGLKIKRAVHVPHGWGTDSEWESELLQRVRIRSCRLQLFSVSEKSTEVVDCSIEDALHELDAMLARTEIDTGLNAPEHDDEKVDWRFYREFSNHPGGIGYLPRLWQSLCYRQRFINSLRGERLATIPDEFIEADRKRGF